MGLSMLVKKHPRGRAQVLCRVGKVQVFCTFLVALLGRRRTKSDTCTVDLLVVVLCEVFTIP